MAKKVKLFGIFTEVMERSWEFMYAAKKRDSDSVAWKDADVVGTATFDASKLPGFPDDPAFDPESICGKTLIYGLRKKLEDGTSDSESDDKLTDRRALYEVLLSGEWERERTSGARTVAVHIEALSNLKGVTVAAMQKAWRETDETTRQKVLANPTVKAEMEKVEKSRADATSVSLDEFAA